MINIYINHQYYNEIHYVLFHWFEVWGNFEVKYHKHDNFNTIIIFDCFTLEIENIFFKKKDDFLIINKAIENGKEFNIFNFKFLSFFYNKNGKDLEKQNNYFKLNIDLIGDTFFWLTDYQVLLNPKYDKFGRFLFEYSKLKKYINRAVVNEIYELIKYLFNVHNFKSIEKNNSEMLLTHDVDHPFKYYQIDYFYFFKNLCGDLILRKKNPIKRIIDRYKIKSEKDDPYYTFEKLKTKEKNMNSIYFFYGGKVKLNNPDYSISTLKIKKLVKNLKKDNSTEIGIHFGLGSCNNLKILEKELGQFKSSVGAVYFSRFHYLSFHLNTIGLLEKCGIKKDSTIAYPDNPGFRTGTCYNYYLYDLINNKMSSILEYPLVLMEGTLLDQQYCNYNLEESKKTITLLYDVVKKYNGLFTILWHNHRLVEDNEKEIYNFLLALN